MTRLKAIGDTAQQVAEAISSALDVETEILADDFTIVAGTGKYRDLIGSKDEEVYYPDNCYLYTRVLKTGEDFVVENPAQDSNYGPVYMGETVEICCPIWMENRIVGIIALVAFDEPQRQRLLGKKEQLRVYLQHMAFLFASRMSEIENYNRMELASNKLAAVLQSINEGIIAVDENKIITHCNTAAETLLQKSTDVIIGVPFDSLLPDASHLSEVMVTGCGYRDHQEVYGEPPNDIHIFVTATPIMQNSHPAGMVISFRPMAEVRNLAYQLTEKPQPLEFDHIKGNSPILRDVKDQARLVATGSSTVLIQGESGTGKELFARAIHDGSSRRDNPFIIVNCGAIPENLMESELFGYEEGSFTGARKGGRIGKFELADGGTILLDEIGDLPLHLQVKILHVLQRRKIERVGGNKVISVDIRVIAATNRNLEEMCNRGEFRTDLYYRLNVIPLEIPPLRERPEDVDLLMEYFLIQYSYLLGKGVVGFSHEVKLAFESYSWPGNVRELQNAVEYAVNMQVGGKISLDAVPAKIRNNVRRDEVKIGHLKNKLVNTEREILAAYAKQIDEGVLNKGELANVLGISRITLYRKFKQYNLG